jgi:hypothetical protein
LGTFEDFQNPQQLFITNSVPTSAFRSGNFSSISTTIIDPTGGLPFQGNQIPAPRISSQSTGILALYPLPNIGTPTQLSNNYIQLRRDDYTTDQYDIRIDNRIGSRQSAFGRYTHKNIVQDLPQQLLVPTETQSDDYSLLALSDSFQISAHLLNESRFGFTLNSTAKNLPFDGATFTDSLGFTSIGPSFPFNGLPDVNINNFTGLNTDRGNSTQRSDTTEATDNLLWLRGEHSLKFGIDYRFIHVTLPKSYVSGDNYGQFNFQNVFTGYSFADFLLGLPQTTAISSVTDANATAGHYAAYGQDSFRVNSRLILEYGVRFDFDPAYTDTSGNMGNFDPVPAQTGEIIYPTGDAGLISAKFLLQINACPAASLSGVPCTPIESAAQAGLPSSLRTASRRLVPRIGFAYRPFGDKTVVRGGFGMYDVTVLGSIFSALSGTLQANAQNYTNVDANGKPIFSFPQTQLAGLGNLPAYGSASFTAGVPVHFKDPYVYQMNLSLDRDLGARTGFRVSYVGSIARQLVWTRNLNQLLPSTVAYTTQIQNRTVFPYPNFSAVTFRGNGGVDNYNSVQTEVHHETSAGLTLDVAYTLAKNLADNQGSAPSAFVQENASTASSYSYSLAPDYGPVYGTPRHHMVATIVYNVPFGRIAALGDKANLLVRETLGGWQINSIGVVESGPFLTPFLNGIDPSGTGSGIAAGGLRQRVDQIASANLAGHNATRWFNVNAFQCPGGGSVLSCKVGTGSRANAPIGRFGNEGIGTLVGPATMVLHLGLAKEFSLYPDRLRLRFEGTFTNVLNHTNLGDPTLSLNNSQVGTITSSRNSYYAGARSGQVGARLEF